MDILGTHPALWKGQKIEILIPSLYLLAGIMVYATIHHFSAALNRPSEPMHLLFGGMCLLMLPFTYFHVQVILARDIGEFVWALRWHLAAILLFFALFPWFIAYYAGERPLYLPAGFSAMFALLFLVNLSQPYSGQYAQLDGLQLLRLPWGETVTRGVGRNGVWAHIAAIGVMAELAYAFITFGKMFLRDRRGTNLAMMIALILFMFSSIQGILTRLAIINFVEPGPIGFMAMIIVMSAALTSETRHRLRTAERSFQNLFDNSPTGMAAIDPKDASIILANRVMLAMVGYGLDEIRHKRLPDFISPEERDESRQRYERLARGIDDQSKTERHLLRKDGSTLLTELFVTTLKDEQGRVKQLIASVFDITERDQMQRSLERINRLYRMLSDISSANIHIRDRNDLFEKICLIAVESELFRMAWIGLLDSGSGNVVCVAHAGHVDGYLDKLNINIYNEATGYGPTAMAIKSGSYFGSNDIANDPRMTPWREAALKRGYRASVVYPLRQSGRTVGAFSLYFHEAGALSEDVIQLLGNLVEDISFALDFIDESAHREMVQNELRELALFQQAALESERKRIARELHDELGQTMTALHFDLKWLNEHIDRKEHELLGRVGSMQGLLGRTVDTVRRISEDLRPGMLDDLGLAAAIEHHVQKFTAQTGIACDLSMNQTEFDLEEQIATALFRIVQESLTNVARHSGATRATVNLRALDDKIFLIVQDNGRGLPANQDSVRKTYGLLGMRERLKMLGGTLDIFNEAGAGARIEACIPTFSSKAQP